MRSLLLVGAVLALLPVPAAASCATLPGAGNPFATAPVVFVGTVLSTSDNDRRARVKVESVWRGPDLLTYVQVNGSPVSGPFTASDVDRHYQAGTRYIFVPANSAPPFDDNSCTATQPYTQAIARQAPADARPPRPGGDPGEPGWWPPAIAALLVLTGGALVVGVYLLRRRGRA
ncbi:MAG TPA: hypothetical protein VIO84_15010 [Candidatus Dormibacteraeota bacterium]|jgi:hypothetical protein